jgi:hypothetical protein
VEIELDPADLDRPELNRAGRRAAEKRAKRMRTTGAVLAAGAATFGTTATLVGVNRALDHHRQHRRDGRRTLHRVLRGRRAGA